MHLAGNFFLHSIGRISFFNYAAMDCWRSRYLAFIDEYGYLNNGEKQWFKHNRVFWNVKIGLWVVFLFKSWNVSEDISRIETRAFGVATIKQKNNSVSGYFNIPRRQKRPGRSTRKGLLKTTLWLCVLITKAVLAIENLPGGSSWKYLHTGRSNVRETIGQFRDFGLRTPPTGALRSQG